MYLDYGINVMPDIDIQNYSGNYINYVLKCWHLGIKYLNPDSSYG